MEQKWSRLRRVWEVAAPSFAAAMSPPVAPDPEWAAIGGAVQAFWSGKATMLQL